MGVLQDQTGKRSRSRGAQEIAEDGAPEQEPARDRAIRGRRAFGEERQHLRLEPLAERARIDTEEASVESGRNHPCIRAIRGY